MAERPLMRPLLAKNKAAVADLVRRAVMPKWLKFERAYDHRPTFEQVHNYPLGSTLFVNNEMADAAIAAGKAFETDTPQHGIEEDDGATTDHRRDARMAQPNSADAYRGAVRVRLRDAAGRERPN